MYSGSCLCGDVRFTVSGDLPIHVDACHCTQCRKQSGHYWASIDVPRDSVKIEGESTLTWYAASDKVKRGFCCKCGSFLFWNPIQHNSIAIAMGAFDGSTHRKITKHIFTKDKGDYYEIADDLPQE